MNATAAPATEQLSSSKLMKRFAAEVIFTNPDDVPNVRAVLAGAGCELEIDYDAIDEYSNYQWGMITGVAALPEVELGSWLSALVRNANAVSPGHLMDLVEWGYGEPWRPSETHQQRDARILGRHGQGSRW